VNIQYHPAVEQDVSEEIKPGLHRANLVRFPYIPPKLRPTKMSFSFAAGAMH
jgi:hypothetical protein